MGAINGDDNDVVSRESNVGASKENDAKEAVKESSLCNASDPGDERESEDEDGIPTSPCTGCNAIIQLE